MGAGKTVVTLSAMQELLADDVLTRVLVIAPLKVCGDAWSKEAGGWSHLAKFAGQIAVATGSPAKRLAAFTSGAKVVVINFENVPWMVDNKLVDGFDGLLVDELTKLKAGGKSFKKLRRFLPNFKWRVGMTGTLVSENIESLFYQMMVVDGGKSFGKNKTNYLTKYFYPTDFNRRNWAPFPDSLSKLTALISGYVHTMADYRHTLPPLTVVPLPLPLDEKTKAIYREMARGFETLGVTAMSVAGQYMKLQQISCGFMYDDDKKALYINDIKMDALAEKLQTGSSLLVVYQFIEELDRIYERFGRVPTIGAGVNDARVGSIIEDWNAGAVPLLAIHPKSGGHGLNLQRGGCNIVWLSPIWSRDLYDQLNARLWRRGQQHPVTVTVLHCIDTVDYLISARLDKKADLMPAFLNHLASWSVD